MSLMTAAAAAAVLPSCGALFGAPTAATTTPPLTGSSRRRKALSPVVAMASAAQVRAPNKKPFAPPREVRRPVTHSLPPQKREIFESLDPWAAANILPLLKPVESSWQPQDYLPDAFSNEVHEVCSRAAEIPDELPVSGDDRRAPTAVWVGYCS